MKTVYLFLLCLVNSQISAMECREIDASKGYLVSHIERASNIFWGQIVSGELVSEFGMVNFSVDVFGSLKGKIEDHVELQTYALGHGASVSIGESHIFFLYGENEIDPCGIKIPISKSKNLAELQEQSDRADIDHAKEIRDLLRYFGKLP